MTPNIAKISFVSRILITIRIDVDSNINELMLYETRLLPRRIRRTAILTKDSPMNLKRAICRQTFRSPTRSCLTRRRPSASSTPSLQLVSRPLMRFRSDSDAHDNRTLCRLKKGTKFRFWNARTKTSRPIVNDRLQSLYYSDFFVETHANNLALLFIFAQELHVALIGWSIES